MTQTSIERAKQLQQAEELLFSGLQRASFAKGLYFGRFSAEGFLPYHRPEAEAADTIARAVDEVRQFACEHLDAAEIDRRADIPRDVIDGLGRVGVLGMAVPHEFGGRGFSQYGYCRVMEVIGGTCASTAVFVNAHHSIGVRALVLFGNDQQKQRWLPPLVRGEHLAAFALTEPEAGSDAANVQTMARPTPDGGGYVLNGEKRYITNGAIADVLTVMARTPVPGSDETKVTAFLVTRDLPGFRVVEERMPKCGIRGTVTSRLAFENMPVPADRVLGGVGKGLKVALTVLDFGRTTFGASCTGAAKRCLEAAAGHANRRRQFGRTLGDFELVKEKLAWMAAHTYAMEAATYQTAALIDRGHGDYMLETALLKVFATEALWRIVNDTIQIFGGQAYFSNEPYERMMRDARINMIGEGANDVLLSFIALVGMKPVGEELRQLLLALPGWACFLAGQRAARARLQRENAGRGAAAGGYARWSLLRHFAGAHVKRRIQVPRVPLRQTRLQPDALRLGMMIRKFAAAVEAALRRWGEDILDRQYVQARIAKAAIALYTASCVLARLDDELTAGGDHVQPAEDSLRVGRHYLNLAYREFADQLSGDAGDEDRATTTVADQVLRSYRQ